ncbi:MAG: sortase [Firmicutes bacterium]|nr:sortase [Bacillota bacterium]
MKNKIGNVFIIIGLMLVIGAMAIVGNNIYDEWNANNSSAKAVNKLTDYILETELIPEYVTNPDMEMPTAEVDGWNYIGIISIESLDVTLPVIENWSEQAAYISPCRYYGSAYKDNMVIAAHNFPSHFGKISDLTSEDEIVFTDMAGNNFYYRPVSLETLQPTDIEEMTQSENDLTLFTCTIGGRQRVTVRCDRVIK